MTLAFAPMRTLRGPMPYRRGTDAWDPWDAPATPQRMLPVATVPTYATVHPERRARLDAYQAVMDAAQEALRARRSGENTSELRRRLDRARTSYRRCLEKGDTWIRASREPMSKLAQAWWCYHEAGKGEKGVAWTPEAVLHLGQLYIEQEGSAPGYYALNASTYLPSHTVVDRLFGSLAAFQARLGAPGLQRRMGKPSLAPSHGEATC